MMIHHFIFLSLVIVLWGCSSKEAGSDVNVRLHDIWALESINGEEFVEICEVSYNLIMNMFGDNCD